MFCRYRHSLIPPGNLAWIVIAVVYLFYLLGMASFRSSGRSSDMDQAGPSSASSAPLAGTFLRLSLDLASDQLYDFAPEIPDVMGLRALRASAAIVKVMSVPNSRCIRVVAPDDHFNIGFHEVLLHDMEEEDLPFVALSELNCLCQIWPKPLFVFMSRYQHDLERMRKECKELFGCTQSGSCTHCGKYIQQNLGKNIALFDIEVAQLWRCPDTWCTVWKGTSQYCVDHIRKTHAISQSVKAANLARYFPPWTVTRSQWSEMTRPAISRVAIDTLLFSRIGVHCFTVIGSSVVRGLMQPFRERICDGCMPFWRNQMRNRFVDIIAGDDGTYVAVIRSGRYGGFSTRLTITHRTVSRAQRPRMSVWEGGGGEAGLLGPRTRFPYLSRKRTLFKR